MLNPFFVTNLKEKFSFLDFFMKKKMLKGVLENNLIKKIATELNFSDSLQSSSLLWRFQNSILNRKSLKILIDNIAHFKTSP